MLLLWAGAFVASGPPLVRRAEPVRRSSVDDDEDALMILLAWGLL